MGFRNHFSFGEKKRIQESDTGKEKQPQVMTLKKKN